jgi:ATP-binding cassette, subfamily B, bacterial
MASNSPARVEFNEAFVGLIRLLRLDRSDIGAVYSFSIFSGLLYLALPLGIQYIIGFVMAGSLSTSVMVLITLVVIAIFLNGLLQIKQLELIEKIEQKIFVRYAFAFADTLSNINLLKMDSYFLPELVNRFFDISALQKSIFKLLIDVPGAAIQIILGTILLSFYHPVFIGFGFLLLILVGLIIWATSTRGLRSALRTSDYKYETGAWLEEIARNIRSYKFNKSSNYHLHRTDDIVQHYLANKTDHFRILKLQYWSLISFKIIIVAIMLFLGISLLIRQEINIGQFIAADIVILSIIASVEKFIASFDNIYDALTAIQKLEKVTKAELEKEGTAPYVPTGRGTSVDFKNVSFSYTNEFPVLRDITAHIQPGEWLTVNGKRGAGKSSIINLLSGAYTNFTGQILINELPIANYDLQSLRAHTGVLLQKTNVFKGSLLENLAYAKDPAAIGELLEIAKYTGLEKYMRTLRNGMDEIIDTYTHRIQAPFLHSILLTRALYGRPELLLLEDPFIHLSEEETNRLVEYIKNHIKATVIIINNSNHPMTFCNHSIQI